MPEYVLVDLEDAGEAEPEIQELITDMFEQCRRYTATVAEFEAMISLGYSDERFAEISASRGKTHDVTISAIDLVLREMKARHFDIDELVTEFKLGNPERRQDYGKFAMLLIFRRIITQLEKLRKKAEDTAEAA